MNKSIKTNKYYKEGYKETSRAACPYKMEELLINLQGQLGWKDGALTKAEKEALKKLREIIENTPERLWVKGFYARKTADEKKKLTSKPN